MTNPIQVTQEDREVAAAIDALEWLFCDGRPNPELLFILARHRIATEHRAQCEAEIVAYLRRQGDGGLFFQKVLRDEADAIERGEHRQHL